MSLGTLAPKGFFTPGDVKNEAELLRTAKTALGKSVSYRLDAMPPDLVDAWTAFVEDERLFYGRSQSFFYFVDFADNASRDQVLALESRFNDLKARIALVPADDPSSGNSAASLEAQPTFAPPSERTEHSALAESGGPADEVAGAGNRLLDKATSIGWQTIAAAVLVVGALGTVIVMVARSGAVKVGV